MGDLDYIVVQAGGKGTRLEYLTKNKPKALVPIENLPMLFHLFRKYPDKKFIIIADYKREVLKRYLDSFATVKYQVVDADANGTCAGIRKALDLLPNNKAFMLVWSDLILPNEFELPNIDRDYIGISTTFPCRWSYLNDSFVEESSKEHGVAGLFVFTNKTKMSDIPQSGELVKWMQQKELKFSEISLAGTREFGLIEEYNKLEKQKCRPFNKITVLEDKIVKEGINEQGKSLAEKEVMWYQKAKELDIDILPQIYDTNPLIMERIKGKNIYEYSLSYEEKKEILHKLVASLERLHNSEIMDADSFSCREAYFKKTYDRINPVRDLIPFAERKEIIINGRKCRNVFFYREELEKRVAALRCEKFMFIHGDCTFSNIMLKEDRLPVLIDPRGYFGFTELYGDSRYDWAKLYYSIVGNYDKFNLKMFRLTIEQNEVSLEIDSNHWEDMEDEFFEITQQNPQEIKLIHALIWLSLCTYAWQDYDSICGAFYSGLYYLEEVL